MDPVDRIELFHVRVPLPEPFFPSWIPGYPQTENRFTLLRLTSKHGVVGVAAGPAFETEREGLGSLLGPYLLGIDIEDTDRARGLIRQAGFLGWRNAFLEAAFWDARGKIRRQPVYRLLNPDAPEVSSVPVYCSTGEIRSPKDRISTLVDVRSRGFHGIKLRVHSFEERDDIELVEQVRAEVGDDFPIMVDANQGWRVDILEPAPLWDLERARRFCGACASLGVQWVEEPLDHHAYDDMATLRAETEVDIAGAELNAGWHEFAVMLEKDCLDIYQPDCTLAGGITDCARLARAAHEQDRGFTPHTWTNGIGFLMNLHLKAAFMSELPLEYPFEPPGWIPDARDAVLQAPITVAPDGTVSVPSAPGLGVVLDDKALRKYGHRFYDGTPLRLALHTVRNKGVREALDLRRRKAAADAHRARLSRQRR